MSTPATSPRPTLLLVDDEVVVTPFLEELLGDEGFAVTVAASAEAGLEIAVARRFDLVLIEKAVPGMGAMELLRQLLLLDPSARVVLVSAGGSIESALAAMRAGASDCILKPADDLASLVARLKRALDRPRVAPEVLAALDPASLPAGSREALRALRQAMGG